MGQVILYIAHSLDGYIADQAGQINWLETAITGSEEDPRYADFYQGVGSVLMGRTTYDHIVTELSPEVYPYQNVASYVFTSRPAVPKAGVTFIEEDIVTFVKRHKKETQKAIWLLGGSSLVAPLVAANLIDEYQLTTIPCLLGQGIPLFQLQGEPLFLTTTAVSEINGLVTITFRKKESTAGL